MRHQQLANSLLSSVNSLLDAFAVHVPAAAALVRRFEAWESLPQDVTQPAEHDILVPDAEQGRYELHDHEQQQRQWERQLRPHLRELPPLRAAASMSPDGTSMVHVGILDVIVSSWDALIGLFRR